MWRIRKMNIMSKLILNYGLNVLEKIERIEMWETYCEDTDNLL